MHGVGWLLVLGLVATCGAGRAEMPALPPGAVVSVPWDGLKNPIVVRVPDGYTADRDWPVIFHFQ